MSQEDELISGVGKPMSVSEFAHIMLEAMQRKELALTDEDALIANRRRIDEEKRKEKRRTYMRDYRARKKQEMQQAMQT